MNLLYVTTRIRQLSGCLLLSLLWAFLAACNGGSDPSDTDSSQQTGSLAFQVAWPESDPKGLRAQNWAAANETVPAICSQGVTEVEAIVYYEAGERNGGPWPCSQGSGTITDIPAVVPAGVFM